MAEVRMSMGAAAAELEIAEATLVEYIKRGLPARKRGGRWHFDLEAARDWIAGNTRLAKSDPRRADAELRKVVALADMRELELEKRRGEVISRAEVREAVGSMAKTLQRRLLGLRVQLVDQCAGKSREEIDRVLAGEIGQLLDVVSSTPFLEPAPPVLCERCAQAAA